MEIQVPKTSLSSSTYHGVRATFCKLDWSLQQRNPSTVPMFRDLVGQSRMCKSTSVTVDLWEIVQRAHALEIDEDIPTSSKVGRSIPPTGVVFHETRCGSTLTANLLASLSPSQTRVYSESGPPLKALGACTSSPSSCNVQTHSKLIQDVFYMMGRSKEPEKSQQYVFYKIQSIGVHHIHAFTTAMPNTPWIFLYRDSVEVMQSHLSKGQLARKWKLGQAPVCGRFYGNSYQPTITKKVVQSKGRQVSDLTQAEYCASHLVSLLVKRFTYYTVHYC